MACGVFSFIGATRMLVLFDPALKRRSIIAHTGKTSHLSRLAPHANLSMDHSVSCPDLSVLLEASG